MSDASWHNTPINKRERIQKMFDNQIQVKVIKRHDELTDGIFKVGTVLDLDL